jgi:hypothetical protein
MAITITPNCDLARLRIGGDIVANLDIPARPPFHVRGETWTETYYIALSDGSLIRACNDPEPRYEILAEGAGLLDIDEGRGTLTVNWPIEWISLSSIRNCNAFAQKPVHDLPLFRPEPGTAKAVV